MDCTTDQQYRYIHSLFIRCRSATSVFVLMQLYWTYLPWKLAPNLSGTNLVK